MTVPILASFFNDSDLSDFSDDERATKPITTQSISPNKSEKKEDDDELIPEQEPCRIGTSVTFDLGSGRSITIREDSSGGCGGKTWEAATILCNYLIHKQSADPSYLCGKRILELGAGTGMVGIVVTALMHATTSSPAQNDSKGVNADIPGETGKVVITDMDCMMDLMRKNVELILTEEERKLTAVEELKWGDPIASHLHPSQTGVPYDLILASDCIYLEVAFEPLVQALCELCPPPPSPNSPDSASYKPTTVLIAYKKRRKADKRFFALLKKHFDFEEIDDDPGRAVYSTQRLHILAARRRPEGSRNSKAKKPKSKSHVVIEKTAMNTSS
ncbi:hypothetical protein HK102_013493 [Quaeritorhiza haematococci]|nr:hypothetical protein HK102_013493 [Quaeritorhiza haematococci]